MFAQLFHEQSSCCGSVGDTPWSQQSRLTLTNSSLATATIDLTTTETDAELPVQTPCFTGNFQPLGDKMIILDQEEYVVWIWVAFPACSASAGTTVCGSIVYLLTFMESPIQYLDPGDHFKAKEAL